MLPLSGRTLRREVSRLTSLKYGPQERQLQGERRISDLQQGRIGDWYGQYMQDVERARQATQAGYSQAQQSIYGQANTAAQQEEAQRQRLAQEQQASAAQRGATVNPALSEEAQRALQARQALSSSFGGLIGTMGANANAYMADQYRIGGLSRTKAHEDEATRRRKVESLMRELQAEKGQYATQARGQLREGERKYALERQAFGLNVAKAQEESRHSRQMERTAERTRRGLQRYRRGQLRLGRQGIKVRIRGQNVTIRGQNLQRRTAKERLAVTIRGQDLRGRGGAGGLSPSKRLQYRDTLDKVVSRAGQHKRLGFDKLLGQARDAGIPETIARAGIERALYGGASPGVARSLRRRYGISVRVRSRRGRQKLPPVLRGLGL